MSDRAKILSYEAIAVVISGRERHQHLRAVFNSRCVVRFISKGGADKQLVNTCRSSSKIDLSPGGIITTKGTKPCALC